MIAHTKSLDHAAESCATHDARTGQESRIRYDAHKAYTSATLSEGGLETGKENEMSLFCCYCQRAVSTPHTSVTPAKSIDQLGAMSSVYASPEFVLSGWRSVVEEKEGD